ncbi:hypothetical protein A6A04_01410 [Paramagnetospirillum marisnigri]|uniref:Lipoprotein n=1 Tax=Paramagnetospirillum marisnigri TaxID=1285242 RepID=A0A178MSC5_9PROT|nr:hypothetical protein [Paramagnetospirillum marisnigri]OAN52375.1 hypothetical protein A6A04_01410 [Paramagnetospirillum marisnigri]
MKRLLAPLVALTLAACAASVPWTSTTVPKDQWKSDYSACRRYADRDVGWREDDRDSGSPFRDYDRHQAKKRFDASLASCMIDRGYVPASRHKE